MYDSTMQEKQLDQLLQKISTGDNEAFELLYKQTSRGVFAFIYAYLKNYQDTEDVLQSVYLKIKLNAAQYRQGTNARAWILQIAKNLSFNELKKRKPTEELSEKTQLPLLDNDLGITDLMNKILDEEERQIIILHVLWGYKHREIAIMYNCPTGTITSKYKRGVSKLKNALKEVQAK